jgi:hypothetical protein
MIYLDVLAFFRSGGGCGLVGVEASCDKDLGHIW